VTQVGPGSRVRVFGGVFKMKGRGWVIRLSIDYMDRAVSVVSVCQLIKPLTRVEKEGHPCSRCPIQPSRNRQADAD